MKYNFLKGLKKAVISVILFGIPVLLQILPTETLNLTLGGVFVLLANWAKVKYIK